MRAASEYCMRPPSTDDLQQKLSRTAAAGTEKVAHVVDVILTDAVGKSASDVHFEPTHRSLEVRYRLDGVLHPVASLGREIACNVIARLKVLAELLTYRLDIPQEGRLVEAIKTFGVEMRVSTFPTIQGEKAA